MDPEPRSHVSPAATPGWVRPSLIDTPSSAECVTERWEPRWLLMLILVYAALATIVMRPVTDPDVWWHLRTGEWILEHRGVPWTDPFSSYGLGKPWIAYNWLFEVFFYGLYRALGLFGPLVYVTVVAVAIALALHRFIMHFEKRFTRAAALTALGIGAMSSIIMPRSYLCSILFFIVELHILFAVRESKSARPLLVLPPLFALWANLHIQFIYGLLALGLAVAEALVYRYVPGEANEEAPRAGPLWPLVITAVASSLATLMTPYHVHLHASILGVVRQTGPFDWVIELTAMDFRQPAHWVVLALTLGAAYVLGRERRIEPFPALLFVAGVLLAFRARRDVWVVVVIALAIVAQGSPGRSRREARLTWRRMCVAIVGIAVVFVGLGFYRDVSPHGVEAALAKEYPVDAARFVEAQGYEGPLFNPYDWGGYLIWRLPQLPVAMDGRNNVHGDYRIARAIATWQGARSWAWDPELAAANVVIAPINVPLTSLLRLDARFELVYEDDVAVVFVARATPRHVTPRRG